MDTSEGPSSLAEKILVEKSQDSVQVTKNRMQRHSLTAQDSDGEVDSSASQEGGQQRKKAKTRFAEESQELHHADKKVRKSLSKRISDALGFRKLSLQGSSAEVEQSLPSHHVKFQQKPQVIE